MARLDANSVASENSGQNQIQTQVSQLQPAHQQYLVQPEFTQNSEIIDDAPPPPSFDTSKQENQQKMNSQNQLPHMIQNGQQNKQAQYSTGPAMAFQTPQTSQKNASHAFQFPPHNTQMRSFSSGQSQPQAFPDHHQPQFQSQASFPPPPPHGQAQAFPPPQAPAQAQTSFPPFNCQVPQAFPSPQANDVPAFPPPYSPVPNSFPQPEKEGRGGKNPIPFIGPILHLMSTLLIGLPGPIQNHDALVQTEPWMTDLFACMDNPGNALVTAFFPFITYGQISEIVDNGQSPCLISAIVYGLMVPTGVPWLLSCTNRSKIRARYGLMEYPAPDWMVHFLCAYCALCQEYRELQKRGLDPSIGWQGNMAKTKNSQKQQSTMMPPMHQTMMG